MTNGSAFRHLPLCLLLCLSSGSALAAQDAGPQVEEQLRASAVCLDCHEDQDTTLAWTVHALNVEAEMTDARVACTDCHGANSMHWEEDPEEYPMINPAMLGSAGEAELCGTCHQSSHQQTMLERNVHARNGINCSECHSVHAGNADASLLKEEQPTLCYSCHKDVEGEFARSYRHPINDGMMQCSECHKTLDETARELSYNGTGVCTSCHAEFQGPFPFEHQAAMDFSTEEGGCLNCHAAHGSDHPMMLEQPYEPPHFQLCSQCHMTPAGHNSNSQHGTMWVGMACNDCHTDIHGSYDNRLFLSESLAAEGCTKAGCHGH